MSNLPEAVSINVLQPSRESYTGLSSSTVMLVNPEQPLKAFSPIDDKREPRETDVRFRSPSNALSPMVVTPSGILTLLRL